MHISSVESDWSFVHVRDYSKCVRINSEIGLLRTPPVSSPELTVYSIGSQIVVVIFHFESELSVIRVVSVIQQVLENRPQVKSDTFKILARANHFDSIFDWSLDVVERSDAHFGSLQDASLFLSNLFHRQRNSLIKLAFGNLGESNVLIVN